MKRTDQDPREYKTIPAFAKVVGEEAEGIVEHLISVFGVLDLGGDITHPGSFAKTLDERKGAIRVLDSHQRYSALGSIGLPLDIWEVPKEGLPDAVLEKYPEATGGVMAKTQFLIETPEGKGVFLRIKRGAIQEFSFAYDTLDSDTSKVEIDGKNVKVRNLRTIRLWEYSPVVFGMNPATAVVSAKSEEEEKPAPDVTENTIRIRVRDPKGFQEGSFRTINIGDKDNGIQAVIGRLKGETSTTIQSYIFDKKKWTTEKAQAWVKEHGKKELSFTRVINRVREAFYQAYNDDNYATNYWVQEVFEKYLIVHGYADRYDYFKVGYTLSENEVSFDHRAEWVVGDYVFVEREQAGKEVSIEDLRSLVEIESSMIEIEQVS